MKKMEAKALSWNKAKHIIQSLYKENESLSVYQSWDYLDFTGKGFTFRNIKNMIGLQEKTFVLFVDKNPVAVAPLLVKKEKGKQNVYLRGMFTGAGNLNFLCVKDFTYEQFTFFVTEIEKALGEVYWCVDRQSEKSEVCDFWKRFADDRKDYSTKSEICVEIPLTPDYDTWYKSLSHSVRQNIRTSYNRVNKDGIELSYELHTDSKIPNEVFEQILSVASRRALEYDGRKGKVFYGIYYLLKRFDPMLRFLRQSKDCTYALVRLDGKLAASFIALKQRDGRLIVPRLSYNSQFYRYSPGGILINETMKRLCEDEQFAEISSFDLSRGEEKYKYDFGGKEHYNHSFYFCP